MIFMEDIGFDIDERILRVLNGVASSREKASLDEWFQSSVEHEDYYRERVRDFQRIKMLVNITRAEDMKQQVCKTLNKAVRKQTKAKIRMSRRGWYKIAGMAAILIVGFMVRFHDKNTSHDHLLKQPIIYPGKSVATITLANGEELEVGNRGLNVREENGMFLKLDSTVITYSGKQADSGKVVYNTLTVPAGGEYRLVLSDGTKVWMNADSKLKYPVAFGQSQREVFLEGEAYFEVTKNRHKPFTVQSDAIRVRVLGTTFNLKSDKRCRIAEATLIEGEIEVKGNKEEGQIILTPGQRAELNKNNGRLTVKQVDAKLDAVWHDNLIPFQKADIFTITKALERFYDVKIILSPDIQTGKTYSGVLKRKSNIESVLKSLQNSIPIDYKIVGNNIFISPK